VDFAGFIAIHSRAAFEKIKKYLSNPPVKNPWELYVFKRMRKERKLPYTI